MNRARRRLAQSGAQQATPPTEAQQAPRAKAQTRATARGGEETKQQATKRARKAEAK
jgi:hypothetical protein